MSPQPAPPNSGATTAPEEYTPPRTTLLNPLYLAVCELAARRGLAVAPLGRILQIPLGGGWSADLSTDCTADPAATMISPYGLRLRRGVVSVHVGPFTPSTVDPGGELQRRVMAAICISQAAAMTGIAEDLLQDNARNLARSRLGHLMVDSSVPPVQLIARASLLLQ